MVNASWLEDQLRTVLAFRARFGVPCWIDQWGVLESAAGGSESVEAYLHDVMELFQRQSLHWTLWIWRRTSDWNCQSGHALMCQRADGGYQVSEPLLYHLGEYITSHVRS
mmetsp:Transcript_17457/g.37725  ORF Transcript_17457/g.37725 Transcript_17457/m.37725 type:complete len:110 (+) Transcript_17457:1072-1401(+)